MSVHPYCVAAWLVLIRAFGIVRSRNLIHAVVCLSVVQFGTYVLLAVGFRRDSVPPRFSGPNVPHPNLVVDPVVQAMTLTDIVIQADCDGIAGGGRRFRSTNATQGWTPMSCPHRAATRLLRSCRCWSRFPW